MDGAEVDDRDLQYYLYGDRGGGPDISSADVGNTPLWEGESFFEHDNATLSTNSYSANGRSTNVQKLIPLLIAFLIYRAL